MQCDSLSQVNVYKIKLCKSLISNLYLLKSVFFELPGVAAGEQLLAQGFLLGFLGPMEAFFDIDFLSTEHKL